MFSNSCLICSFLFTYVYSITVLAIKFVDDVWIGSFGLGRILRSVVVV